VRIASRVSLRRLRMHSTLSGLLQSYGYYLLFALVGAESFGIPLPGETSLVTAAALAALGRLDIYAVVAVAAAAAILGDNGGYWIGRKGGLALIRRHGRLLRVDEMKVARIHAFFDRYGAKTIFSGRLIALLRTWAAFFAGVASMPYSVFMVYNALGGVVWATLFGTLGYVFGRNLPRLERYIGQASRAVVLLLMLVVLALILFHRLDAISESLSDSAARLHGRRVRLSPAERFRVGHSKLWAFVAARFAAGEYLGLHLTVGLLVSLAALCLLGGVTEGVVHHDPLTQFDVTLADRLHAHATTTGSQIFTAITLIGSPGAMAVLAVSVGIVLIVRRRWWLLGGWVAAFLGGSVIDQALKMIIHRPRPRFAASRLHPMQLLLHTSHGVSYSFPSGHALGSLIGYGMLAYLLVLWLPGRHVHVSIVTMAALLVLAVGFSRLYLGVHYFSDVVAGYAAGVVWLSACISGLEIVRRHRGTREEAVARSF
jgi:membrane protein DedA with SNARE-associated domain/membrane-associated phospholipid phosphatase